MGPFYIAASMMWSLSLSPKSPAEHSITKRQDLDKFEGVELHHDTDVNDPVVGDGSADFKWGARDKETTEDQIVEEENGKWARRASILGVGRQKR
jgi:hypothetical protein